MSNQNYITEMLELKDNNVIFKENVNFYLLFYLISIPFLLI